MIGFVYNAIILSIVRLITRNLFIFSLTCQIVLLKERKNKSHRQYHYILYICTYKYYYKQHGLLSKYRARNGISLSTRVYYLSYAISEADFRSNRYGWLK